MVAKFVLDAFSEFARRASDDDDGELPDEAKAILEKYGRKEQPQEPSDTT